MLRWPLVAILGISFAFPPALSQTSTAAEPEFGFQRGEWLNRSQPAWINNAPDNSALKQSSMLEWGPRAKPLALDRPARDAGEAANTLTPLMVASEIPASILGERQGKRQIPENLHLSLESAQGDPNQVYRGVHILETDPASSHRPHAAALANSQADAVEHSGELDHKSQQQHIAVDAQRMLEQKVQLLRERARTNATKDTSRIESSYDSQVTEQVVFAEPTPPLKSYGESHKYQIAPSDYQVPANPPRGGQFAPQGFQPAPANNNEPAFALPDPQTPNPSRLEAPSLQAPSFESQQFGNEPPNLTDDVLDDLEQSPAQSPPNAGDPFRPNDSFPTEPLRNQNGRQLDDLFKEPSGSSRPNNDLDAELKRLEDESDEDLDADLEKDLKDLGLDEENKDDTELSPDNEDDGDDLPSKRDDDEKDGDKTKASDCGRVYNDRDCCDEDTECQTSFDKIRNSTLASLSIDISPSYNPSEKDPNELIRIRTEKLAAAPSRSWMDRHGNVIANGALADFRQGKLHIRSDGGGIVTIPYRELSRDDLCFVNSWWGLPAECPLGNEPMEIRNWTMTTFTWTAAATCHKPLYFEHLELERYGHSAGPVMQPVLSGAHFFANVILLPYHAGIHPPTECMYDLGNYRPGDCAPWLIPAVPLHRRATLFETALGLGLWGIF